MAFRLPRLPAQEPPWPTYQLWWQRVVEQIEAQEDAQNAVIDRIRRLLSHTSPTTILTSTDAGTTGTITVANHTRVYADGTTVNITGIPPLTGLVSATTYGLYYDDLTLSVPTPTVIATTAVANSYSASAEGRHFLGVLATPPAGSGKTYQGGGAYPANSTIGGEI